jgi:hypothetical protein
MRDQPAVRDKPIFFDQTGLRWKLTRIVLFGLATGFCLIPFLLALSILNVEVLPEQSSELAQQITPASPPGFAARVRRLRSSGLPPGRSQWMSVPRAAAARKLSLVFALVNRGGRTR